MLFAFANTSPAFAAAPANAPQATASPTWADDLGDTPMQPIPHSWTTVKGAYLRVHGHPDNLDTLLRVAQHGSSALPRLSDELGLPIGDTIHVYVVGSDAEFRALQPGKSPSWADAVAYPALGAIYLRDPSIRDGTAKPLEQVFDHELVHIVLGRGFAPSLPPSWLQEGVAQLLAGEVGPQVARDIQSGMATGGLIPLQQLERRFPNDAMRARLAYAQSADFVAYLQNTYGDDVVEQLVTATRDGSTMAAAVRHVSGDFLDEVEADWDDRFAAPWTIAWSSVLNEGVLYGFGGMLLAVGGILRKRRFHKRMDELAREEAIIDDMLARMIERQRRLGLPAWTPPARG
jgi:hypothetical protein